MITLLSPAKSMDLEPIEWDSFSLPEHASKAQALIRVLKTYSSEDLKKMMNISDSLAEENVLRFKKYRRKHSRENAKQAIFTFNGDVYRGLDAESLSNEDIHYAQDHLRILSGLYGILRPLDLIQPYRLEMGSKLANPKGKNLYEYWGNHIANSINRQVRTSQYELVVNLASKEYSKAANIKKIKARVIDVNFKEYRDGELKFLSFNAKRARGLMARYIVQNQVVDLTGLKAFAEDGYGYDHESSSEDAILFVR